MEVHLHQVVGDDSMLPLTHAVSAESLDIIADPSHLSLLAADMDVALFHMHRPIRLMPFLQSVCLREFDKTFSGGG